MRLALPFLGATALAPAPTSLPRHVGVVMDGNRRWARTAGHLDPSVGHRYGADHVEHLLQWCTDWGVEHVTTYVLSADNIRKRPPEQVDYLFELLAGRLPDLILCSGRWALHVSGNLDLLSTAARNALVRAERETAGRPAHLTMAIGYDGHRDIVDGHPSGTVRARPGHRRGGDNCGPRRRPGEGDRPGHPHQRRAAPPRLLPVAVLLGRQ